MTTGLVNSQAKAILAGWVPCASAIGLIVSIMIQARSLSTIGKSKAERQSDVRAASYLAPGVKREIIYRMLEGEKGALFYKNMLLHQEASGIGKVIDWIKAHFDSPFTIEELAELGNMSVSNLHYKFKEVTAMAPLQYQKRLRLQEARRLLLGGINVTETALQVGYQSSTQFSREYKRLFGLSPLQDIRMILQAGGSQ